MKFIRDIISEKRAQAAAGGQNSTGKAKSTLVLSDEFIAPLSDVMRDREQDLVPRDKVTRRDIDSFEFDAARLSGMLRETPAAKAPTVEEDVIREEEHPAEAIEEVEDVAAPEVAASKIAETDEEPEEGLFSDLDDADDADQEDADYEFDVFDEEVDDLEEAEDEFTRTLDRIVAATDDDPEEEMSLAEEGGISEEEASAEEEAYAEAEEEPVEEHAGIEAEMADETLEFEADEFEPELDEEDDSALNAGIMSVLSAQREETEAAAEEETPVYAFDAEDELEEMEAFADEEEPSEPLPVAEEVEPEPVAEQVAKESTDEERRVALLRRFAAMEAKVQEPEYDDEEEQASAPMENGWTGAIPRPVRAPAPLETAEAPQTARLRRAVPEQPKVAEHVAEASPVDVPAPAAGRASRRAGRVKTRLLGFSNNESQAADPFAESPAPRSTQAEFPVGWLIIVNGPGRGTCFTLQNGVAQIGRGEDQAVRLDFGDNSISRANHAAVAYDAESRKFYLGHGGKANLVRLNNRPVLSTEELDTGNLIRIGETTLRFVALCGKDFDWTASQEDKPRHVSFG